MAKAVKSKKAGKSAKPTARAVKPSVSKPASKARRKPVASKRKAAAPVAKAKTKAPGKKPAGGKEPAKKIVVPTPEPGIYTSAELAQFQTPLVKLRERINHRIHAMADDSLKNIDDTPSEDRTDDFDREFALNLVSSEHDVLFEIDDALRRIQLKTYGKCDGCSKRIEKIRLKALPFARMCVKCQSESERGRTRFRPFGETLAQGTEAPVEPAEVEETE